MAQDVMRKFYTILNLPLYEKLNELTQIIDQSMPNKDLQALFPQLVSNIFSATLFNNGWGLRTNTCENNRHEYLLLMSFLEPHGPMFRLCYKLLSDPQLKYNIPLDVLPLELQLTLERGRCPQFYADMIVMDSQAMNVVALALNPFDYYIFNFALHLVSSNQNMSSWENWNSVYFALACDYLMHFLPSDPNVLVTPLIPNYTGKALMSAPLQTANRPMCMPSLLLIPDLSAGMNNQHSSPQPDSRNEVWRSETVLQVFVDIWMSVEEFGARNELYKNCPVVYSSPERVRIVRVLVKHIHAYSAKHMSDPATRSCALRKYARQIMCARAYHYIRYLVTTWPLDASFRLVMELWLSLIQPWRYTEGNIHNDRFSNPNVNNQEEGNTGFLDASHTQFIAENFPSYTCIFYLVLPRFMRLDLTAYKNAVMLFRLGKVFSQPHLIHILKDLEKAITENSNGLYYSNHDTSWNDSNLDQNNSINNNSLSSNKWVAVAKQAMTELNLSPEFQYAPIWSDNRRCMAIEFVQKIAAAHVQAEKIVEDNIRRLHSENRGVWASIKYWLMIGLSYEDELTLEECKKVPTYLATAVHQFSHIFGLNERNWLLPDPILQESASEHSSFTNSFNFPLSITNKLRNNSTSVQYMGDPDLMPITSYESTILVRILYQIATRLNEIFQEELSNLWNRTDFWGYVAREVLQRPCAIHTYVKDVYNHQNIVTQNLPARISFRRLGSHSCIVWLTIGYMMFRFLSYSGWCYAFCLLTVWLLFILTKASCKRLGIVRT